MYNKYKNTWCKDSDGYNYHSKLEKSVAQILREREKDGELVILKRQQRIHLYSLSVKLGEYWPDFTCRDMASGKVFWVESKGKETERWQYQLGLWRAGGPGLLEIWKGSYAKPRPYEKVTPELVMHHVRQDQVFGKL